MSSTWMKTAAVACGAALLAGSPAQAQSPFEGFGASGELNLMAGGIVVVAPVYEGSKKYEVKGVPFVAPGGADGPNARIQVKGPDDVRLRLVDFKGLQLGALGGWRFGREEDDDDRLRGLGDVDGGLVLGAYAAYQLGPVTPFVSYHHQVRGSDTGYVIRFGVETEAKVNPWLTLKAMSGFTYADSSYMESFFGVSTEQAARSRLATFDADAAIKDFHLQAGADLKLDDKWGLKLSARYTRLLGDAADSSITETENQFTGVAALTYKFNIPLR